MEMPLMVNAAVPVFLRVTVCAALVVPVCAVKVSEVVESETAGAAAVVPVPVSATLCGEPVALSVMETAAAKLAADAGVKVTAMLHDAPAATELPQVLV